jgi:hypothetical protein
MSSNNRGILLASSQSLTSPSSASANTNHQQQSQQLNFNDPNNNNNNSRSKYDFKMVLDQMCCAICLEILVNPQTIVPCGHTYCGPCLGEMKNDNCPECRSSMTSRVPALQLKGLIESLVQVPNTLNPSDIEHYQDRKKTDQCQGLQVRFLFGIETSTVVYNTCHLRKFPCIHFSS